MTLLVIQWNSAISFEQRAHANGSEDATFCESVWQLKVDPPLSDTVMHRNATLIAKVLNVGEVRIQT